jgi:hypothetical protein
MGNAAISTVLALLASALGLLVLIAARGGRRVSLDANGEVVVADEPNDHRCLHPAAQRWWPARGASAAAPHLRPEPMGPASPGLKPHRPVTPTPVVRSTPPIRNDEDDDLELIGDILTVEDELPDRR